MTQPEGTARRSAGQELYRRARRLIPGGTQLLSKRAEMFLPERWPAYFSRARGVEVTDLDGHVYVDMSLMGIGACVLGYADPDVDTAVKDAVDRGVASTLNAPEEVELAELLCELHPWAGMVRFARSGGEAMAIAVRIARAHTGRDTVAFCGYHGWSDWYLAANLGDGSALDGQLMPGLEPAGVPRGLQHTALPFHYNQIDELHEIVKRHGTALGAIVMEPQRDQPPAPGFLEGVRDVAREVGAVLVFDEVTTGFRVAAGGLHRRLGVDPDIVVFAKAMANGYAMAAIVGREEVMQAAQSTFISSTNWTERVGPAASLATIRKLQRCGVPRHLETIGTAVLEGWERAAEAAGLPLHVAGPPSMAHFTIDRDDHVPLGTLFTQLMLDRGFLAWHQFKPSYAHRPEHVERYLSAATEVMETVAEAARACDVLSRLEGGPARRGFYRLT